MVKLLFNKKYKYCNKYILNLFVLIFIIYIIIRIIQIIENNKISKDTFTNKQNDFLLVMSVFITHKRERPNRFNRLDIFKYTLQSYSKIQFSHVYLYIKLDDEFKDREDEIRIYAKSLFINVKEFSIEFTRFEKQDDLSEFIKKLYIRFGGNQLVWFMQADDHVFIDTDTRILQEGIRLMDKSESLYKTLYLSHWPEIVRVSGSNREYQLNGNYIIFNCTLVDSLQIFNLKYLYHIIVETICTVDNHTKRIDSVFPQIFNGDERKQTLFAPLKEQCRKFDGYGHVEINPSDCPPLILPAENNIFLNDTESLKKKILAHRGGGWPSNNFVIPEEWILIHENTYK